MAKKTRDERIAAAAKRLQGNGRAPSAPNVVLPNFARPRTGSPMNGGVQTQGRSSWDSNARKNVLGTAGKVETKIKSKSRYRSRKAQQLLKLRAKYGSSAALDIYNGKGGTKRLLQETGGSLG